MALFLLVLFLVVVAGLAWPSSGDPRAHGCCAPADPADDLRMRPGDPPEAQNAASDC